MTSDRPFPFSRPGTTLVTGPSNTGKTRLTAAALDAWVAANGPEGVVVLEFAPEVERDGLLLGGRLAGFTTVPDDAWHGVLEAHAPRAEGDDADAALALARDNAARAGRLLAAAPAPRAVFVNDATIPYQADGDPAPLIDYCDRATVGVLNAFDSDELGDDDAVSRGERAALDALSAWADRRVRLGEGPEPPDI